MALRDLMVGAAPPSVNTTKAQATTAPQFYTDYLTNIANLGSGAVSSGGVAGFSPLQEQAFGLAGQTAQASQPYLQQASNLVSSGTATTPSVMADYMNPYTQDVVQETGRLGMRNLTENILPQLQGSAVGTGQYGSKRGLEMQQQAIRDTMADIAGKQGALMASGYTTAQQQAAQDLARQLSGAATAGQLGSAASQTGIAGLNALSTLGAQQQAQEQAQLNYPMTAATNLSQLLKGYTMPTSVTETYSGPMAGLAYQPSPLAQIAALMSATGAYSKGTGSSPVSDILGAGRGVAGILTNLARSTPSWLSGDNTSSPWFDSGVDIWNPDYFGGTSEGE